MTKQKWHILFAKTHKWIALILGLQLLAWTVGGLVMTWLPIEEVRGQHKVKHYEPKTFKPTGSYVDLNEVLSRSDVSYEQIIYTHILDKPVIKAKPKDGSYQLYDALSGDLISPISKELAQVIAEADYRPDASVEYVSELTSHNIDYKGQLPVWRVDFSDTDETSLYVSQTEGRVVARRSNTWRLFDFFWMLHIMDYDTRDNINNPLVISTSLFAVLFTISGITLIFFRFFRRDFNFLLGKKKPSRQKA